MDETGRQFIRRREERVRDALHLPSNTASTFSVHDPLTVYSQQITDLQREIEQKAIQRQREIEQQAHLSRQERDAIAPQLPSDSNSSSVQDDPVTVYSQQIIDLQREIEQKAIQRQREIEQRAPLRREESNANAPQLASNRSNNSSTQIDDPVGAYSQQIIDLKREIEQKAIQRQREIEQKAIQRQREIEQQPLRRREESNANAPQLPSNNSNSSSTHDPVTVYSQQIIDLQREIEQKAIQRQREMELERRSGLNGPHMPARSFTNSTIRTSNFTITPSTMLGSSNSDVNYPNAPPLTPDGYSERHIYFTNRSNSEVTPSSMFGASNFDVNYPNAPPLTPDDDGLPSYEQAVAFKSTVESVAISRY